MMENPIFNGMGLLLAQVCLAAFIVFVAMMVDLASGLYKAKIRGEVHSSWGLKRSVQKFILYEGAILIAAGIDILFLTSHFMQFIGCEALTGIAIFTSLVAVLLCVVEIWSLREKADEKTRKDISRVSDMIGTIIDKRQFSEALTKAITEALKSKNSNNEQDNKYLNSEQS